MDTRQDHTSLTPLVPLLVLRSLLLIVPLAIALVWGSTFGDDAYVAFRCASNLAAGRGLIHDGPAGLCAPLESPLYVLVLWLPAALGIPLPQAGLILSALGWGIAALAIYGFGQAMHRSVAGITAAALVAFSPTFVSALGTQVPWVIALACIAATLGARKRWRMQTGAMVLMLCLHFAPITLATAALLLGVRWIKTRRFPLGPAVGMAVVTLVWVVLAGWGMLSSPSLPSLDPTAWVHVIEQLVHESEFYWLYLPAICVGLVSLRTSGSALWVGLPWIAIAALRVDTLSSSMLATLGSALAGLGVDSLTRTILKPAQTRRPALAASLVLILASPLAIAQASSLLYRHRLRPVVRQALEGQAAAWLRAYSEPAATVLSSARVGFLSERGVLPWDADASDASQFAALAATLSKHPPDYCVSYRSLAWDRLVRTAWFQGDYASSQRFLSPYDAASPVTVWHYLHPTMPQPVEATLGDQIRLLSARAADSVAVGETLAVRLDWTALRPVAEDYIAFVHLIDGNGARVASHDGVPWDRKSPTHTWLPGDVVPDVHRFPVPPDTPPGTYTLWVGMYTWPDLVRLPVWDRAGIEQPNQTLFLRSVQVVPADD
ncbi:MAG TPA: hypothetical protein VM366_07015 [Anaerolineae bacterium]|nr:hypothetical protein [Anaerolineae bacterium]